MKKTRELRGMTVLALQEGERLGQVRDFILDPVARQVVALVLDRRIGGEDQIVATANVRNVGPDAITVENRSSLVPLSRIPRFQELTRIDKPIRGKVVISEGGVRLGQVEDLAVDVQTFRLVSLVLKRFLGPGQVIPAELVRTIGADAIVVCEKKPEGAVPIPPPPEPVLPPSPPLAPEPVLPGPTPAPFVEPATLPEPLPAPVSDEGLLAPELPAAPVPPSPDVPPPGADEPPPDPDGASAAGPAEEGENAWQRWVRRLKNG